LLSPNQLLGAKAVGVFQSGPTEQADCARHAATAPKNVRLMRKDIAPDPD
jgi:hypothetical protein